nr:response regulator transcription factor [Aeromicrobium stalagmiti]
MTRLLEAYEFEVVAAVDDAVKLGEALRTYEPDIAVVDVRMPPTFTDEGLRAAIAAREDRPGLPVLVLSQYVEQLYARELLGSGDGSVGYLLKDRVADVSTFVEAVRTVAAGGTVLDPEVVSTLIARAPTDSPVSRLTDREREVLGLMAEGRSNAAIAAALFVTEKAISKHTSNIFMKLDLDPDDDSNNRRVMAVIAYLQS